MEKRKSISLNHYFTRILLLFALFLFIILSSWVLFFLLSLNQGILSRADWGEKMAGQALLQMQGENTFTEKLVPEHCDYFYMDANKNVISSSLQGQRLEKALDTFSPGNAPSYTSGTIFFTDGSSCTIIWSYQTHFLKGPLAHTAITGELFFLTCMVLSTAIFVIFFVTFIGKRFRQRLFVMQNITAQIAAQDLDLSIPHTVGIREFDQTMEALDHMRGALKQSLQAQWESEQNRRQDVAALTHDIKTPLTVISGNAELLVDEPLTGSQKKMAGFILSNARRAQHYIQALQQLANLDLTQEAPRTQQQTSVLLETVKEALSPLAKEKDVHIEIQDRANQTASVFEDQLVRALINIGENAIRYSPKGRSIQITADIRSNELLFCVQDHGPGFSKEALLHAKEPFWRQEKSRTGDQNYGLGLAIAQRAAHNHGGTLHILNRKTGGLVEIRLPLQKKG